MVDSALEPPALLMVYWLVKLSPGLETLPDAGTLESATLRSGAAVTEILPWLMLLLSLLSETAPVASAKTWM